MASEWSGPGIDLSVNPVSFGVLSETSHLSKALEEPASPQTAQEPRKAGRQHHILHYARIDKSMATVLSQWCKGTQPIKKII